MDGGSGVAVWGTPVEACGDEVLCGAGGRDSTDLKEGTMEEDRVVGQRTCEGKGPYRGTIRSS